MNRREQNLLEYNIVHIGECDADALEEEVEGVLSGVLMGAQQGLVFFAPRLREGEAHVDLGMEMARRSTIRSGYLLSAQHAQL